MIPILLDTQDLSAEFSLTREDVDGLLEYTVKEVTKEFAREWENQAKRNLGSSRNQYIKSIRVDQRGRFTGVAYLDPISWLVNAVEMGAESFDMKGGMLSSPKAKQGKNGRYMIIPFRFATPDAIGESSIFAGVMPPEIKTAMKAQEKESPSSGLQLGKIPSGEQMPKSHSLRRKLRSKGFERLKANTEMTSKYEGLKSNTGGCYVNFRVVSENSDASAFIHPGIDERDLAGRAEAQYKSVIPTIVDRSIDNYLVSLGF